MKIIARQCMYAIALVCLLLGGCVETRFESPLGDNIETCDTQWKGLWSDPESKDEPSALYVDDACQFIVIDQPEKNGPLRQLHVPMNYVHVDGKSYLVIADTSLKGLVELKAPYDVTPVPAKSYYFARYKIRGDNIEVNDVDSERVAKLVIDRQLEGTVSKTSGELHVYVHGDRAKMLEIVRKQSIFQDNKPTKLRRRHETLEEFERSVSKPPAQKPA